MMYFSEVGKTGRIVCFYATSGSKSTSFATICSLGYEANRQMHCKNRCACSKAALEEQLTALIDRLIKAKWTGAESCEDCEANDLDSSDENLTHLHDEYIRNLIARDLSPSYIELQRATLKYITEAELSRDDLNQPNLKEKFAASLPIRMARTSKLQYIANLVQFANWCANSHYTDRRHRHERTRYRPKARELPTAAETRLIFETLRRRAEETRAGVFKRTRWQNELIVRVLYETGARISEALGLYAEDVRQLQGVDYIVLRRSLKTAAAERAVEISDTLASDLAEFRRESGTRHGRLFKSRSGQPLGRETFANWLTKFCDELKISCHVTPHTFRYAWILGQIIEGKSALEVMTRAGHEKVDMTVYYFNQVRRLFPTVPISGDVALLERQMQTHKTIFGERRHHDES